MNEFATVLNCMDGRIQRPVADFLLDSFGARYLDTITAAGMVRHVADETGRSATILGDVAVSRDRHGSTQIAITAHHDCAGNPVPATNQQEQLIRAAARLGEMHPDAEIVALWVDQSWAVHSVHPAGE